MWRCLVGGVAIVAGLTVGTVARADPATLAALLARTDAVAQEVSRIRGLPLKHAIPNEVVDRDELHARLVKLASDQKTQTETRAEGIALARWGLIPLDTDYVKLMVDLLTDQIAGYYDPETKKLTISQHAGDDPDWAEMVLAHELDHGLQDQTYDLHKFEDVPATEGDSAVARHALVEGDGIALMIEVMLARKHLPAPWANPEVAAELEKAMEIPNGDSLDRAPLAIREALMFPYRAGFAFVAELRRRKPWSGVDAAFKRPPRSTEQILHPEKYFADDLPIAISAAPPAALAGYAVVHSTVWGELGFDVFLRSHGIPASTAALAAAGWGGDRAIVLARDGESRPDHAIGLARLQWDSEADAIEAQEATVRAVEATSIAGTTLHAEDRTRWLTIDGMVSAVERRGTAVLLVIGVPARHADAAIDEAWVTLAPAQANK